MERGRCRRAIIVVHEIYGLNDHIKGVCKRLKKLNYTVISPNLLGEEMLYTYSEEDRAYLYFVNKIGFNEAAYQIKKLARELRSEYTELYIVGFSVGATIAWLCSNEGNLFTGVIGFYGSRIRDYLNIMPACDTLLFFPKKEKSFNTNDMIKCLEEKTNVHIVKVNSNHGFTDQSNSEYSQEDSELCFEIMENFILAQNYTKN